MHLPSRCAIVVVAACEAVVHLRAFRRYVANRKERRYRAVAGVAREPTASHGPCAGPVPLERAAIRWRDGGRPVGASG